MSALNHEEHKFAHKWVQRQLREGVSVGNLHVLVDEAARGVLGETLEAERRERHRADEATVERDRAVTEVERLRAGIAALTGEQAK